MKQQTLFEVGVKVLKPHPEFFVFRRKDSGYCLFLPEGTKLSVGGLLVEVVECYVRIEKDSIVSAITLDYGVVPDTKAFEFVKRELEEAGFSLLKKD